MIPSSRSFVVSWGLPLLLLSLLLLALASAASESTTDEEQVLDHHFFHAAVGALRPEDPEQVDEAGRRVTSSTFEKPVYIPFDQRQDSALKRAAAYRFAFTNLHTGNSRFVLYPQAFSTSGGIQFDKGALISTTTDGFSNAFSAIADDSSIDLAAAKALYDINVAILTIEGQYNGMLRPLTYESYDYCAPLYNYINTKYAQCWRSADYWAYIAANPSHEATSVVYVDETDVKAGRLLLADGYPRFGALVVPDIYAGADAAIAALLGADGRAQLQAYLEQGGLVFSSGKGALLLQTLGLVAAGTLDTSNTLVSQPGKLSAAVSGCGGEVSASNAEAAWAQRTLCFSPTAANGSSSTASLQSAPVAINVDGFTVVSQWDGATVRIKNGAGAVSNADPSGTYPHVLWQAVGRGQLVLHLGNPVLEEASFGWFFDALFLAMSEPIVIDAAIVSGMTVIPAYEQLALSVQLDLKNIFGQSLSNVTYLVWVGAGLTVEALPSGCTVVSNAQLTPPGSALNGSIYLDCSPSGHALAAFGTVSTTVKLFIADVSITQRGTGIPLVYPQVNYTVASRADLPVFVDWGPITVDAYEAALIRSDMNADPLGFYPLSGSGIYVDNVLTAENKANTQALDVTFISYVPLISPLVDIGNQAAVATLATFDWLYYDKAINKVANYSYPFVTLDPRDKDYLDYALLLQRGDLLAADWDIPVKNSRLARDPSLFGSLPSVTGNVTDIANAGYASTTPATTQLVTQQVLFSDADSFYGLGVPRMLAFLELSDPKAFAAYNVSSSWPAGAPSLDQLNAARTALRQRISFARSDVYFYKTREGLPLPQGLTSSSTFSLDQYEASANTCGASTASKLVEGHFGRDPGANPPAFPRGYRGAEWQNELLLDCDRRASLVDLTSLPTGSGPVRKVHYVVPLTDNSITTGDDVMDFVQDTSVTPFTEWYYSPKTAAGGSRFGEYKDVRIVPVWHATFELNPNTTRKGGYFTFTLPSGVSWNVEDDPVGNGYISYGADQVAITSTSYDATNRVIKSFFKRGNMPNEAYGKSSQMTVTLERLRGSPSSPLTTTFALQELIYDFSVPAPHESYRAQTPSASQVSFTSLMAFSLPALRLEYKLQRGAANNESFVQPYESFEPFMRNGMYFQELRAHQTVWGSAEIHPDYGDPGLVTTNGAFSLIASLGISSIPFREYLTTGPGQMIPLAGETSRIEWSDIWDRRWAQPVRSTFVDAAPIPGPLRNFQMTTTYEMLDPTTGARALQWQSDESLVVRAQVKVLNNYEKWFELTDCAANQVLQLGKSYASVVYGDTTVTPVTDRTSTNQWINYGHNSSYGGCLQQGTVILAGQSLSASQRQSIADVQVCSESKPLNECKNLTAGLPKLGARPSSVSSPTGSGWNYMQQVADHWPAGYILEDMWDFTHTDYWDSSFGKGYPWHFDNPLPNVDSSNPKPFNLIAFPIPKGLGYAVSYSSNQTHPNFAGKRGWWSDQLQNKDDTLVAGQSKAQGVSVGAPDLTSTWIDLDDITNPPGRAAAAKSNIYVCEFNQKRVQVDPANPRHAYLANVVLNNVVPVDPSLTANDPRLTSYACSSPGYSPANISQFNNYVATETARDWLYFAANLRGGSKEDVNVLYALQPIDGVHREGVTPVVDGGRFTYWNPGLGPNAFADVDNPVSTVLATRTDLEVAHAVYPTSVATFNATVLQLVDLTDPDEVDRAWTSSIYYNSHGFGDAQVTVYVGGYKGTDAVVSPGTTTFVRVTFANNAGFDWNLLAGAIDFEYKGSAPISANDLLTRYKHAIQEPLAFNFLQVQIPEEYKPYVSIKPSNHNIDTAPLQFDFQAINVATIRDGFKGDYYYQLTVAANIPESLRGKLITLNVTLLPQYFDKLPGPSDPTGIHDYTLSVPPIKFGVPLSAESQWPDQVFWTSGFAHSLQFTHTVNSDFEVAGVFEVNDTDVNQLALVASEQDNREAAIDAFWQGLSASGHTAVPFTVSTSGTQTTVTYALTVFGSQFPFPRPAGPDLARLRLLVRTVAPQLPYGWNVASYGTLALFKDDVGKQKQAQTSSPLYVRASGPWVDISYSGSVVTPEGLVVYNQQLYQSNSGMAKVNVTATNSGSDTAFNTDVVLLLPADTWLVKEGLAYESSSAPDSSVIPGGSRVVIRTGATLAPGEFFTVSVSIRFEGAATLLSSSSSKRAGSGNRTVISNSGANLALTSDADASRVSELVYNPYEIGLTSDAAYAATLVGREDGGLAHLNVSYSGVVLPVQYVWYRRNSSDTADPFVEFARTNATTLTNDIADFYPVEYKVAVVYTAASGDQAVTQTNIVQFDDSDDHGALFWFLVIGLPLIGACIGLTLLALLILAAALLRRRANRDRLDDAEASGQVHSASSLDAAAATAAAPKAPRRSFFGLGPVIVPTEDEAGGPARKGRWVVDMDYLFTGARRVVVKDGNPTSNKPPEDWVDPGSEGNNSSGDEMDELSGSGRTNGGQGGDAAQGRQRKPGFFRRIFRCF